MNAAAAAAAASIHKLEDGWGDILLGVAGLLAVIGAGLKFLWTAMGGKQEKRIARLEAQVERLNNRLQMVAYHGMAMHAKLKTTAPDSSELEDWDRIIHQIYPLQADTPHELLIRAVKLDD